MTIDVNSRNNKFTKLTALAFEEAALDSPSFRTSVNHFHMQVLGLENWIQENTNLSKNKPLSGLAELNRNDDSMINRLLPPISYLNNGLVENQAYTPAMVNEFQMALKTFASSISSLMYGNPEAYLSTYLDILVKVVKPYKEVRENFDYYQGRYDVLNKNYHELKISTSISTESIRDKAMELYDIRKLYRDASFDLLWSTGTIQLKLDELISKMIASTIPSAAQNHNAKYSINISDELELEFTRYRKWTQALSNCLDSSSEHLRNLRSKASIYSEEFSKPSKSLKSYDITNINSAALISSTKPNEIRKSGWLYMKTKVRASGRTIWLKRWCFLEKGMFGMLMASTSKTFVEESDKFGILLISFNYNPQEDRRYCFDLKIINRSGTAELEDIVLTFQAETLEELSSWLTVLNYSKKQAYELDDSSSEYATLFSRVSPLFIEFACSSITEIDFQTTSVNENQTHSLLHIIQANPNIANDFGVFKNPTFGFPIMTQTTKLAVISNAFAVDKGMSCAVSANIWGVAGTPRSFNKIFNDESDFTDSSPAWNPISYQSHYPEKLKPDDLLFRSIFSGFIPNESLDKELLLFKEHCICSLSTPTEYPSTIFITPNTLYIYTNFMGFVCLNGYSFKSILGASVISNGLEKNKGKVEIDLLHKPNVVVEVFFCDPYCLCEKILATLENSLQSNKLRIDQLVAKLDNVENTFSKKESLNSKGLIPEMSLVRSLNLNKMNMRQRQRKFQLEHDSIFRMDFRIPCRALAHLMFGDTSTVFHECTFLSRSKSEHDAVSAWFVNPETKELVRKMRFRLKLARAYISDNKLHQSTNNEFSFMDVSQTLTKATENLYYEVDQKTGFFSLPLTKPFCIETKYVIIDNPKNDYNTNAKKTPASSCSLYTYYNVIFVQANSMKKVASLNFIDKFIKATILSILRSESRILKHVLSKNIGKLGNSSKIVKAIRIGGQIGVVTQAPPEDSDYTATAASNQVVYTKMLIFKLAIKWAFVFWSKICINGIRFFFGMVYGLMTNLMMLNRLVLGLLMFSILTNIYLSQRATFEFWAYKKAEKYADSIINLKTIDMERSISLDNLAILTNELTSKNEAIEHFFADDPSYKNTYQELRNDMALRRNEILIELSLLNNVEKELIGTDFKNFLLKEIERCSTVRSTYKDVMENNTKLRNYCNTCEKELGSFNSLL
ncbi:unnamed protein product [Kluyveromyces dobzhanskii CBS 2104]|uniref:WGS project CCBQ000000000 data, contig MAT n=1 Tax=Kluyveromyces dobzhanskii CBS 2104 TaxID=1427455 RepID=A0A0A8L191_9SACH|nr:unnamed protein product [Kluyveromyces dobzhanskii CBS 2104]